MSLLSVWPLTVYGTDMRSRIRRKYRTLIIALSIICLMHMTGILDNVIAGLALRYINTKQIRDFYVDDGLEENGTFYYRYQGEYPQARTGTKMGISWRLRRHLGWEHLEFTKLTPEGTADFVVVGAASGRYIKRLENMVWSVQRVLPNIIIIIYDLGLDKAEALKVQTWCNVKYRQLDFRLYPPHVHYLDKYSWKPIVVMEVLRDYSGVLWLDSSAKLEKSKLDPIFQVLRETDGALCLSSTGHSTFAVTHPDMYEYLPTDLAAAKREGQWEANSMFLYRTKSMFLNVIKWWVLCALEQSCVITNQNPTKFCSWRDSPDRFNIYAGCHRFDQSALNILLLNHFDLDPWKYYTKNAILQVERHGFHGAHAAKVCA